MTDDRIEGAMREGVGHVQDAVGGLTGDGRMQLEGKLNQAAGQVRNVYAGKARDAATSQGPGRAGRVRSVREEAPVRRVGISAGIRLAAWTADGAWTRLD